MVSSITTIRLFSQQAALNAFSGASENRVSGQSSSEGSLPSLADVLSSNDDDGGYEDTDLSALITSLQQTINGNFGGGEDDGAVDDMSSKAFMKALLDKLQGLKDNPDTSAMAEKMLEALEAGTLTVTDAANGEQITAWNISDSRQTFAEKTSVETSDWSNFLKDRLVRDTSGRFVRGEDSSFIEKATGASSYFGMVGDYYYYLSWTAPATETAAPTETV